MERVLCWNSSDRPSESTECLEKGLFASIVTAHDRLAANAAMYACRLCAAMYVCRLRGANVTCYPRSTGATFEE